MRRDLFYLGIFTFIAIVLVFLNIASGAWLQRILNAAPDDGEISRLRSENTFLKAELAKNAALNSAREGVPAFVYSRYPFNLKHEILVSAGRANGVKQGQAVLFENLLLGRVKEVNEDSAVAQTIFDGKFELAVRIGNQGADALLKGGADPYLDLILRDSQVRPGDSVYSAAPEFPFGLAVGLVKDVISREGEPFAKASLSLSYGSAEVKTVEILIK